MFSFNLVLWNKKFKFFFCSKSTAGTRQKERGEGRKIFTKSLIEQSLSGEEDRNKEPSLMSNSWNPDHLVVNKKTMDFLTDNMKGTEEKGEEERISDKKRFPSLEKLSKCWISPAANTPKGIVVHLSHC